MQQGTHRTLGVTDDDLVTGDAVALRVPAAGPGTRIVSGAIDVLVTGLLPALLIVILLGGLLEEVDDALFAALAVAVTVLVCVVVPCAVETLTRGRSLGRLVMGTCIVRADGGPVAFRQSLTRALVGFVEIWGTSGALAVTATMLTPRAQRLGDLVAGTVCVRERLRLQLPAPVAEVPQLAGWARGADIAPLPDGLALQVRAFLHRREAFDPFARARLGADLARAVSPLVSPQPPAGTPPEALLQAVVAERSRRDGQRLRRDDALRARLHLTRG